MTQEFRLIDVDRTNLERLPCCGIKSPTHPGRRQKLCWLRENLACGLRARILMDTGGQPCGYIEYVPGESAWRGVNASGYLLIHCLWNHSRQHQHKGWGSAMLAACVEDAKREGRHGVAAIAREGPWLADRRLFLAHGFHVVDTAPPDYALLANKLQPDAPDPSFRGHWEEKLARYRQGLTLIQSGQCPYVTRFATEIRETAEEEYGLRPRIVELHSCREAQEAPTPYAGFALIYKGRLLADHPISRTRFRNIMRGVVG